MAYKFLAFLTFNLIKIVLCSASGLAHLKMWFVNVADLLKHKTP